MNINVIVVNVPHDLRPMDRGDYRRERDEQFVRTSSKPLTATPVEEVIELVPQNGVWFDKEEGRAGSRPASFGPTTGRKALYTSPTATTYDHEGKVLYSAQDKGLRINITA